MATLPPVVDQNGAPPLSLLPLPAGAGTSLTASTIFWLASTVFMPSAVANTSRPSSTPISVAPSAFTRAYPRTTGLAAALKMTSAVV